MLKGHLSIMLIGLLFHMSIMPTLARSKAEKEAQSTQKVKAVILKLGIGEAALISVKLRDKTKLEGYISESSEDHFVVTNAKTGVTTSVAYPQVKQVKGNNLSTKAKIAIGVLIGVAVLDVVAFIVARSSNDPPEFPNPFPNR